jgi:hypothetical protein
MTVLRVAVLQLPVATLLHAVILAALPEAILVAHHVEISPLPAVTSLLVQNALTSPPAASAVTLLPVVISVLHVATSLPASLHSASPLALLSQAMAARCLCPVMPRSVPHAMQINPAFA